MLSETRRDGVYNREQRPSYVIVAHGERKTTLCLTMCIDPS